MDRRYVLAAVVAAAIAATHGTALADLLKITGFAPASGPAGTTVVITGGGMSRVNAVAFAGVGASFRVDSARQVTATVPNGATTGRITVTRPGSTATSATDFTITTPPASTPWSSWQHDAQHTGRTGAIGPSGSSVADNQPSSPGSSLARRFRRITRSVTASVPAVRTTCASVCSSCASERNGRCASA